ncbi:hypothetical protein CsSME_00017533 [Camellia sinensis var. sinensis]
MEISSIRLQPNKIRPTDKAILVFRDIPDLIPPRNGFAEPTHDQLWPNRWFSGDIPAGSGVSVCGFASVSMAEDRGFSPTTAQLLKHPVAMVALVPKDVALFAAGAIAGAAAKTVTAPLDRIKLLMQTHGLRAGQEAAKKGIGFIEVCYQFSVLLNCSTCNRFHALFIFYFFLFLNFSFEDRNIANNTFINIEN